MQKKSPVYRIAEEKNARCDMKNCPNCGELLGDSVKECFKCHYSYLHGRVITSQESRNIKEQEEKKREVIEKQKEMLERQRELQIKKNALYEYKVEVVNDLETGEINNTVIQHTIDNYSSKGWRLHTAFVNEVGKNATSSSIGFLGLSINATICQTVLVFERCIKETEQS